MNFPMNLQIFAEGVEDPAPAAPESEEGAEVVDSAGAEGVEEQDPAAPAIDQNAIYAAARRKAEQEYNLKIQERDQRFRERFGTVTNPITGKPIQNEDDYFSALDYQKQMEIQKQMQDQGVDPNLIEQAIANSPMMRQAQQIIQKSVVDEGNRELESQVQQISAFYPEVKSLEDIARMDTFGTFDSYVRQGLSLVDAFRLANFDSLSQRDAAATRQAAINAAKGKGHLSPVGGGMGGNEQSVEIPAGELELWQTVYPGLSYKELKEKYNRSL